MSHRHMFREILLEGEANRAIPKQAPVVFASHIIFCIFSFSSEKKIL